MLNQETKRRIDSARDILVGKVPDPKAQVEQITTAMIYKFMDDMDKEAQELGGKARFFTNGYEKYSWTNIMDPKLGGHERLNIYAEAVVKMAENPHIPQLFRDIFKDSFLPYRSPETLSLFLKEINRFTYVHSEDLGDAFEYLLSVLGSQGDAGQFRTPRHIIDFIADIVDPKKDESILDPACGTAGFLISAYKHILKQHKDKPLNPEDKKRMMNYIVGYDISPDMVKLSKVNMYLHGFPTPHIFEYDTLSSEEKWDETYDVIMANPPFMTPKGGIRPHKRFSVQANRAEVLFVNYIMEHLNNNGRAGIIVPEGIIFQSGNAYRQLRKLLVDENYLWAVVSLPAGVFQPYSGVKTSILFLDRQIAKQSGSILFIKVENDGYGLGAQRREIDKNDLPLALTLIDSYKRNIPIQNTPKTDELEILTKNTISIFVPKSKIRNLGDYYLTGDRYKEINKYKNQKWPMVELSEVLDYEQPTKYIVSSENYSNEYKIPVLTAGKSFILGYTNETNGIFEKDLPVIIFDDFTTAIKFVDFPFKVKSSAMKILHAKKEKADIRFLFYMMQQIKFSSGTHKRYWISEYSKIKIPLPSVEVQREIVKEIEGYKKVIDGARQVVDNWKPVIIFDPKWKTKTVVEICTLVRGSSPRPQGDKRYYGGSVPRLMVSDVTRDGMYTTPNTDSLTEQGAKLSRPMKKGEVVMAVSGNPGLATILSVDACIHDGFVGFRNLSSKIFPQFFYFILLYQKESNHFQSTGAVFKNLNTDQIKQFRIPVPSLDIQKQIVNKIEEERKIVEANKKLIQIFEKKIEEKINEVWGEK